MTAVVDASIVLRQADEPRLVDAEHARQLMVRLTSGGLAVAPSILYYEVGNGLRGQNIESDVAPSAMQLLLGGIRMAPVDLEAAHKITVVSAKNRLTFYDAAYLELAVAEGADLLTNDDKLQEAGRKVLGDERSLSLAEAHRKYVETPSATG